MKPLFHNLLHVCSLSYSLATAGELPNVVRIEGFAGADREKPAGHCLGFIVEADGFLLTNYQNLTDPASGRLLEGFRVNVAGKSSGTYDATVVGVEPTINLGILKIQSDKTFDISKRSPGREVAVGDSIAAVSGFENGNPQTVAGKVVGLNTKECYQENLAATMFRATIQIPMEGVGGPVFFADTGELAAIFTGYKPTAEVGHQEALAETHLLPIRLCFNIYDSIKQTSSLKSPWTGFSVRPLNAAEQKFFPTAKRHHGGVAIEYVWDNSPAQKLGIKVNDILVQFSYNRILSVADFQKWLYMNGVGHPVKLMILRNGAEYLITDYVIEERPAGAKPK